uniref:Uncharacterized protein n=1 Tax=viral metagenome TaxID=1070528 RepID=A0A6C0HSL6_9ZZZZ
MQKIILLLHRPKIKEKKIKENKRKEKKRKMGHSVSPISNFEVDLSEDL